MDFLSILILGLVQGITEWLPISSKTVDTLVFMQFLGGARGQVLYVLLFLHLGTVLAATIYFRERLISIAKGMLKIRSLGDLQKSESAFYLTALLGTGIIGLPLLLIQKFLLPQLDANLLFILMGAGLLVTSFLLSTQLGRAHTREEKDANWIDGIFTGLLQGLSAVPGISRSGCTTSALVWRKFSPSAAFELSFILSIPTVILAEIILYALGGGLSGFDISDGLMLAASSFVFGYLMIGYLIGVAKKINLAKLAAAFGILMVLAGLLRLG